MLQGETWRSCLCYVNVMTVVTFMYEGEVKILSATFRNAARSSFSGIEAGIDATKLLYEKVSLGWKN